MAKETQIVREFRVRFAQIDGARVIYYPRYLELIADTFPEVSLDAAPFDLAIRFARPNRLGDDIQMRLAQTAGAWSVSGTMDDEHFSVGLTACAERPELGASEEAPASFETAEFDIRDWMCGPSGRLHLSRYYELISHTVEQWFDSSLGLTFSELHVAKDIGIPTVQMDTRCQSLPASGETVRMGLRPLSVGASAVHLKTWLSSAGKVLLETVQVIVFVNLGDKKITSIRIPDTLRNRLVEQVAATQSE